MRIFVGVKNHIVLHTASGIVLPKKEKEFYKDEEQDGYIFK